VSILSSYAPAHATGSRSHQWRSEKQHEGRGRIFFDASVVRLWVQASRHRVPSKDHCVWSLLKGYQYHFGLFPSFSIPLLWLCFGNLPTNYGKVNRFALSGFLSDAY
jgi:hypothetical protein